MREPNSWKDSRHFREKSTCKACGVAYVNNLCLCVSVFMFSLHHGDIDWSMCVFVCVFSCFLYIMGTLTRVCVCVCVIVFMCVFMF